ncbi:MAG TPA: ABC transporter permease [Candidatus Limnocylindrales bacterium]
MSRRVLAVASAGVLLFLYLPIATIFLYAFNADRAQTWPITSWTTSWFGEAIGNDEIRSALLLSLQAALGATALALLLGTLAAFAVHRFRFFGRETISFMLVLPIALPGIVTGMALNATFNTTHLPFSPLTIIVGHATFCVVTVYNNVIARLRRSSRSIEEASMDLGADTWQTFRRITLPVIGTALLAGGLLAFALSFDEVIVTTFTAGTQQTLPIWILANLRLPNQRPLVNVVAVFMVLLSAVPVYVAQRLSTDAGAPTTRN